MKILIPLALFLALTCAGTAQPPAQRRAFPSGTPYGFVENKGQVHDQHHEVNRQVKFLAALPGMNIELKENSFSYDTYVATTTSSPGKPASAMAARLPRDTAGKPTYAFHRVDISLIGAAPHPTIVTEEPCGSALNYFVDGNRQASARQFARVTYQKVYPGIDLVFETSTAAKRGFEYYFVIYPGGDPDRIRIQYKGANSTCIKAGAVELAVDRGVIAESIPASFVVGRSFRRLHELVKEQRLVVSYKAVGKDLYGFHVPAYNSRKRLVIDPTPDLVWGTYYGQELNDYADALATDAAGNLFMGGATYDATGIATSGQYQSVFGGQTDALLGKFTADGKLLWMTYFGGEGDEATYSLAVDPAGDVYLAGVTGSTTKISTPGAFQQTKTTISWGFSGFIAKFDNDGHQKWATYYGGDTCEYLMGIAIDKQNNIVIAGWTFSKTGIASPGAYKTSKSQGNQQMSDDAFVAKFTRDGQRIWSTYYGDEGLDGASAVAIDPNNNIIITGNTTSGKNIATAGSFEQTPGTDPENGKAFIARFSAGGNLLWATYYGAAPGSTVSNCLAVDHSGNMYAGGYTNVTAGMATAGAHQGSIAGQWLRGWLVKFNAAGSREWGTYFGGDTQSFVWGVAADDSRVWATGEAIMSPGVATANAYQTSESGSGVFVSQFSGNSGQQDWGTWYGDGGYWNGVGKAVIADGSGDVYVSGETSAQQKVATCGALQEHWVLNQDLFVAKFGASSARKDPSVSILADEPMSCPSATIGFHAKTLNAGDEPHYQWRVNQVNSGGDTSFFSSGALADGDKVDCILIAADPCIVTQYDTSTALTVRIATIAAPVILIRADADSVCKGQELRLIATPVNAGTDFSYQWLINGQYVGGDSAGLSIRAMQTGDAITCELTKHYACGPDSIAVSNLYTVKLREAMLPTVTIAGSKPVVCAGDLLVFHATAEQAGPSPKYEWQVNGVAAGSDQPEFSSAYLKDRDQVQCLVTPADNGCLTTSYAASNIISSSVAPLPGIYFSGDTIISKGSSTTIGATVTGIVSRYTWTTSSGPSGALTLHPTFSPATTTTYALTAYSDQGCMMTKVIRIVVLTRMAIPNSFTPNGDGKNDVFRILYGSEVSDVRLSIYNRYGQLLCRTSGGATQWDGTFHGAVQDAGNYVWTLVYQNASGGTEQQSGSLLLIR